LINILHLTDPHLFADRSGELRGVATFASLRCVLDHYRDGDWQADIALVTGDIVHDDSTQAYGHFAQLLGALEVPVYCLPGNHDVRALMQEVLPDPPFHYCETLAHDNWLVVSIDSCVAGSARGQVPTVELDRLDAEIAATDAAHVMVCLHHPPVLMRSRWLDSVGLENREELLQRVAASGKVRLVAFGHVHQPYDAEHDGVRIIGTPSTCRQFKQGSALFAVDDNPPAYRRIRLLDDGSIENELVWLTEQ
jgi:Icc protein